LDLKLEEDSITLLNAAVVHCSNVSDNTTRQLFEEILKNGEEHIDWLETQLETIKQVGLENYLTEQIRK
jgi:bacterioferritin